MVGQQRVAQHVPADHDPAGQALQRRRAYVIGVERLDRARPGHAGDVAEEDEHERDGGKDQIAQLGGNDEPGGALAVTGSTLRTIANTTMRTTPDTNSGTVDSERLVVLMTRSTTRPRLRAATTPPRMPRGTTMTKANGRKLERTPESREEEGAHRRLELVGGAEIAPHDPGDPAPVLDDEGAVDAELVVQHVHCLLRGEGPENRPSCVARQHLTGEEDDQAQQHEREQRQADTLQHIQQQLTPLLPVTHPGKQVAKSRAEANRNLKLAAQWVCPPLGPFSGAATVPRRWRHGIGAWGPDRYHDHCHAHGPTSTLRRARSCPGRGADSLRPERLDRRAVPRCQK